MPWLFPISGFQGDIPGENHPGGFGFTRKYHRHEGVDLYCAESTSVLAVESGTVVAVLPFTGPKAGSPWWLDTMCVMIDGPTGVVNYGEIEPWANISVGLVVFRGASLGTVKRVLKTDKGRPTSMLHLELYQRGTIEPVEWGVDAPRPAPLLDPTEFLRTASRPRPILDP